MSIITAAKDSLYKETYVSHTPYYHPEIPGGGRGESGIVARYSVVNDSFATIAFIVCMILSVVMIYRSSHFIRFQIKNLIRTPRENSIQMRETSSEARNLVFFAIQAMLMLMLMAYFCTEHYLGDSFKVDDYTMMLIYGVIILAYYLLHEFLMLLTHPIYFTRGQRSLYWPTRLFLMGVEGAFLLPIMLLHIYFMQDIMMTVHLVAAVMISTLLLRFYKLFSIFFKKKGLYLQFFLYLCTLEAVPIALVVGAILFSANYLKITI